MVGRNHLRARLGRLLEQCCPLLLFDVEFEIHP